MARHASDHRSAAGETLHSEPAASHEQAALDAVLRATADTDADERVTAAEVEALRDVARRHGPVALTLEPIAVELVEAIILINYGHLRRPPEVWRATASRIASLLFESPVPRARLENLWARLLDTHDAARTDA
jgi:hypothetical protein